MQSATWQPIDYVPDPNYQNNAGRGKGGGAADVLPALQAAHCDANLLTPKEENNEVENANEHLQQYVAQRVGLGPTIAATISVVVVVTKRGIDGVNALAKDPDDA